MPPSTRVSAEMQNRNVNASPQYASSRDDNFRTPEILIYWSRRFAQGLESTPEALNCDLRSDDPWRVCGARQRPPGSGSVSAKV